MALQQSPENHDSISRKRKSLISFEEKIEKKKKYDEEEGEVVTPRRNFDLIDNFISAEEENKLVEDEISNIEDVITNWNFDLIFENWISMAGSSENQQTEISVTNSDKEWLSLLLGVMELEIYDEI
ncbi:hypothetical protein H5410_000367 [Solanum commersonii]|uniref:Uncharacterized protein n=1 Tax=Solanum commersonii TaxID=4109 RepID=A0A9J6AWL0_SOLCO|nr:hypothetical protein H5410_000367 [Solanum commersonii]